MRTVRMLAAAAVCLLASSAVASAQEAPKESKGLFSNDEKEVLEYLSRGHRIPHFPAMWARPDPKSDPRYERELDRALELYRKGSTELRLAIAKRLCDSKSAPEMWNASGPDDVEARHSLVGLGLVSKDPEFRKTCWEWLVTRADPALAPILLKRVTAYGIQTCCQGMPDAERNRILPLVEALYRRPGKVTLYEPGPGDMGVPTVSGSVPALALGLLPATPEARDLVIRWLTADCWKMDRETLDAAWGAWSRMAENPFLSDAAFVRSLVVRRDVAEAWLLRGDFGGWQPKFSRQQQAFRGTILRQVFHPDERIRRAAIRRVLGASGWQIEQQITFFRAEPRNPMRRRAAADAIAVRDELAAAYTNGKERYARRAEEFIAAVDGPTPPAPPAAAPTPAAPAPAEGKGAGPLFSENEKDVLDYVAECVRRHPDGIEMPRFYAGLSEAECDRVLPLVERIYRRTGTVVIGKKGPGERGGEELSRSLPALAMDMLPPTARARDLLLGWMTADCVKMPPDALIAAWEAWVRMGEDPDLFDAPFVASVIERRELAEAWVLSAANRDWRSNWCPKYERQEKVFRENIWRQVFNPDERVRRAAVRTALGDYVIVQWLGNQPPNPLRREAVATAREIVADILSRVPEKESYQREVWTKRLDAFIAAVDR